MNARTRLSALLAAGSLVMALAAVTSAAPPTYSVSLTKSASPANVPVGGASVVYTLTVTATGTGFFGTVVVDDGMAGCTLAGPTGDTDTDGNLDPGENWAYSCTVAGVTPGTMNTASVTACHNSSGACNQANQDAADTDSFTVGEGSASQPPATDPPATDPPATDPPATDPPATDPPATDPPATDPPATDPPNTDPAATATPAFGGDVDDDVDATEPSTDTLSGEGTSRPADRSWMLVVALGLLLASIIVITPSSTAAREDRR